VELFLLTPDHVTDAYVRWLNDPKVNAYLESRFVEHTHNSTRDFVQACLDDDKTLFLGIRSKQFESRHVGNIKLGPIDKTHGLGEVGILVGDSAVWGHGIGCDAILLLSEIAKDQLYLRKLTAGCYGANVASRKVFEKAGFEVECERKDHFVLEPGLDSLILMCKWL
jgi:RimJ/RimL family protein N-acetyltransferase